MCKQHSYINNDKILEVRIFYLNYLLFIVGAGKIPFFYCHGFESKLKFNDAIEIKFNDAVDRKTGGVGLFYSSLELII